MATVRNWRDVRAEAVAAGRITEDGVKEARQRHEDEARAWRLRQVRQSKAARQEDIAAAMHVTQSRVSRIEHGDIAHAELATIRAYVEALGGHLSVTADFGDEKLTLG